MSVSSMRVDEHREYWEEIAKKNGWYTEPFYVMVWVDENDDIVDSVSYIGMTEDVIIE